MTAANLPLSVQQVRRPRSYATLCALFSICILILLLENRAEGQARYRAVIKNSYLQRVTRIAALGYEI
jgi:hypothetical protein